MPHHTTSAMAACITNCLDCHRICLETVQHCLKMGGQHADAQHIGLLLTCADICQTSANAMLLGTAAHRHTCAACAEICAECAQACAAMGDDATMKACADACRRCVESCRQMAA